MSDPRSSENVRTIGPPGYATTDFPSPLYIPVTFVTRSTRKSVITITDTSIIFYGKDGKQSTIDIEKLVNFFN